MEVMCQYDLVWSGMNTLLAFCFRASLKLGLDRALLQSMAAQKDSNVCTSATYPLYEDCL